MADIIYQATGRRKTSVARVTMKPGSGELKVNGRDLDDYFSYDTLKIKKSRFSYKRPKKKRKIQIRSKESKKIFTILKKIRRILQTRNFYSLFFCGKNYKLFCIK